MGPLSHLKDNYVKLLSCRGMSFVLHPEVIRRVVSLSVHETWTILLKLMSLIVWKPSEQAELSKLYTEIIHSVLIWIIWKRYPQGFQGRVEEIQGGFFKTRGGRRTQIFQVKAPVTISFPTYCADAFGCRWTRPPIPEHRCYCLTNRSFKVKLQHSVTSESPSFKNMVAASISCSRSSWEPSGGSRGAQRVFEI